MDAGSDRGVTGGVRKPPHLRLFWQVTARRRVLMTAVVGVVAGVVAALFTPWQVSTLIGWDVAAVLNVSWVATTAGRFDANETRRFATREDDSRFSAQFLLLGAGVASLVGVGFDLVKASQTQGAGKGFLVGMGVFTVVASSAVVHTTYALRYAHEYYGVEDVGGIDFKSGRGYEPDYRDFAYVAFTVGMTWQVSDTDIQTRRIRRTILAHALFAYLFGAVILAASINVVASLLQ
ncbi:MAG: DUF1345 domain-containing protein [Actinomycetota bacterium]|jgi:uncharacterized membrane protein|nr:DUF1345 domain-containing protein [Actinomycetota bacterium]